jgi:membrane protein
VPHPREVRSTGQDDDPPARSRDADDMSAGPRRPRKPNEGRDAARRALAALDGARTRLRGRVRALRRSHAWIDHLARAGVRYTESRGTHFAAAIMFYTIVTAVPLLMVVFAAAGYVLAFDPSLLADLQRSITAAVPAGLDDTVELAVVKAVEQRAAVAGFGLLGAVYTGVWWVANLRDAVMAQWAVSPAASTRWRFLLDAVALAGLGAALIGSFALTAVVTGLSAAALEALGWTDRTGMRALLVVAGLGLGVLANTVVVFWIVARLPRVSAPLRVTAGAALLGAVGIEILQAGTTVYLRAVGASLSGAVFGSLVGLLLFGFAVFRFLLFVTAWAATACSPAADLGPHGGAADPPRPAGTDR